jgi:hypothetical protein
MRLLYFFLENKFCKIFLMAFKWSRKYPDILLKKWVKKHFEENIILKYMCKIVHNIP